MVLGQAVIGHAPPPGSRTAPVACPGEAAGRRRAGRWCRARPRRSARSPRPPPRRRGSTPLPLLSMSSCCRIGGQPPQPLVVGQHGMGVGAEEVGVPDADAARAASACCASSRRRAEVLVHVVRRRPAARRSGRRRWRWRSAGRSTTTASSGRRPSPRTRTCCRARCRSAAPRRRWWRRPRSGGRRRPRPARRPARRGPKRALVIVSCVVKVLEATMNSVDAGSHGAQRLGEVRAVDVGDEVQPRALAAVRRQRLGDHRRAQVGAADAEVDDVGDACAAWRRSRRPTGPRSLKRACGPGGRAPRASRRVRPRPAAGDPGRRSATCSTARCSVLVDRRRRRTSGRAAPRRRWPRPARPAAARSLR